MRQVLLFVLAASLAHASPPSCAVEEQEVRDASAYLRVAKAHAEESAPWTAEERYAAHMTVQVALKRRASAVEALAKCHAGKKVTP